MSAHFDQVCCRPSRPAPLVAVGVASLILTTRAPAQTAPHERFGSGSTPGGHYQRTSTGLGQTNWSRIYVRDVYVRDAVGKALRMAAESLQAPKCKTLLTEFSDQQGRALTERLVELKMSLAEYVNVIIVEDGDRLPRCDEAGVLAFTVVQSRVIYVCGRAFARAARRDAEEGKAIFVHELLHSLGLGENPPSPSRITHRVKELCW